MWHRLGLPKKVVSRITRNRKIFSNLKQSGCYLDIGCGRKNDPSFCNLDYNWYPGIDVCWDVTKGLPFPDTYVAGIFTEHMLEHIPFSAAINFLGECRRVLLPGGLLRIVMPDGELYLSEYSKHLSGQPYCIPNSGAELGFSSAIIDVNRIFRGYGHQFIWDFETLQAVLVACGFSNVVRRSFGEGADPKLLRDSIGRRSESFYAEAC
jgi:predicted SAM-dependent methyltransferase